MCDQCGESVRAGAEPRATGRETRKADARGTIRRFRLGHTVYTSPYGPDRRYPAAVDLCARCATPDRIAMLRATREHYAERHGARWEPAR